MKILMTLALSLFLTARPALALDPPLTPAQGKRSYDNCMNFLKLPAAKQAAIAKKSRYSLSQMIWACHLQARHSLAWNQRAENNYRRAYQQGLRGGNESSGGSGGGAAPKEPYGGSGGGFAGPGICTNGVCSGPGGTTICSGGVCN